MYCGQGTGLSYPENRSIEWQAVVSGSLAQEALALAMDVADRLRDPSRTAEKAQQASNHSGLPSSRQRQWTPYDVANGNAGVALLFGQLDRCFPNQGWDRAAHAHLELVVNAIEEIGVRNLPLQLFGGLAGLCFSIYSLSKNGTRYQRILDVLDNLLCEEVLHRFARSGPVSSDAQFSDYDLISGLAGIGSYLLLRQNVPLVSSTLDTVFDRLIFLSTAHDTQLPFFVPPQGLAPERRSENPEGAVNCGLAHGVPGPLAFFALARLAHVERQDIESTALRLVDWIIGQRCEDAWGVAWPAMVSLINGARVLKPMSRAAWCYGSPGVARALWLAGCALNDTNTQDLALAAMSVVQKRPTTVRGIPSPILCHGMAGLLQIVVRFANDTRQEFLTDMAGELVQQIVISFEPESLGGFRDLDLDGRKTDDAGFLQGSVGISLALLAATTTVEPSWDRLLLLS